MIKILLPIWNGARFRAFFILSIRNGARTYATLLYNSEVDAKQAQKLLGHANFAVTMDIYTHLDEKKMAAAREKINKGIENLS